MMNNFFAEPNRHSRLSSKEENDIREIFYRHWEKLKNQLELNINRINGWCFQTIQEIKDHAEKQIQLAKSDFKQQRNILESRRSESLNIAKAYHESKRKDLFDELSSTCQFLKYQLVELQVIVCEQKRPKITLVEMCSDTKKSNTSTNYSSKYENNDIMKSNDDQNTDSPATSSSLMANGIQGQTTTSSTYVNDETDHTNNMLSNGAENQDESITRCPICFMIFSLQMTRIDRHQHVNEHMVDEESSIY